MKKFILAVLMLPMSCFAGPFDLIQGQLADDGGTIMNRLLVRPSSGTVDSMIVYTASDEQPHLFPLNGCSVSGGAFTCAGSGGTVTSVGLSSSTLSISGSPVTTSGSITANLPNTGTAGTYTTVTTDAQGRVTAGNSISIAGASRSLVTSTSATGFQVSATRNAMVCYEGVIQTTSTIGGPASGSVFMETANTNSTTPSDWTIVGEQTASNTITLAAVLQNVDGEPWSLCRMIPAGKYVRIRSQTNSGTVVSSINSTQQETVL